MFSQDAGHVLVRDPKIGRYDEPVPVGPHASRQWEYALMSDAAYEIARQRSEQDRSHSSQVRQIDLTQSITLACDPSGAVALPSAWKPWTDFPDPGLSALMRRNGLFLVVFEREVSPRELVVVFEGTNFTELPDWKANLRWFLRFLPGFEDQYTVTASEVAKQFHARLASNPSRYRLDPTDQMLRHASGEPIRIVAAGHSLGGGLAQHFAYSFVQVPPHNKGPKVSEVFAFDPSPVTGWFSAADPPRTYNAHGLRINRIFEHGEVLAYVRLLTSRLSHYTEHPSVWEYRYNFDPKANLIRNHSMHRLACGLHAAGTRHLPLQPK